MDRDKNKKSTLLLMDMDIEQEMELILQQLNDIQGKNLLTIQSYGPLISHPYGDIMRSVIISIYQENVKEIFIVGTKGRGTALVNVQSQLDSLKGKIQTLDYLFQNCMPEFSGGMVCDWLTGIENVSDNIEKSVEIIRHHPLVPSDVKVQGLMINNIDGKYSIIEVPTNKTVV
jgi:carbonic anhydrase